ncbi:MAG: hypothetical protein JKY30_06960 [Flavobacteriales bacterium]|nr:hypothetical protein [Flavobacteriales bacterium]
MKLSEFKKALSTLEKVSFRLPNGKFVETHIHITEVGMIKKQFIDCGGVVREELKVGFQLWKDDNDIDHRLLPKKLSHIIELSEKHLTILDEEIEVEYQAETIGKYGVEFNGFEFVLTNKLTACLAEDNCGIPEAKEKVALADLQENNSCCDPTSGCC